MQEARCALSTGLGSVKCTGACDGLAPEFGVSRFSGAKKIGVLHERPEKRHPMVLSGFLRGL